MNEVWKDIHFWDKKGIEWDFRGLYQVSNFGRVKSLKRTDSIGRTVKQRIMKAIKDKKGYELIFLYKNSKGKKIRVHRLVAYMFIVNDNPIEKIEVNHIDENKENNRVDNLEWCTPKYNSNYGTRNKRHGEMIKGENHPNLGRLIARYDLDLNLIDIKYQFEYFQMGFDRQNITNCCKGRRKTHKGYIFKYYEEVKE